MIEISIYVLNCQFEIDVMFGDCFGICDDTSMIMIITDVCGSVSNVVRLYNTSNKLLLVAILSLKNLMIFMAIIYGKVIIAINNCYK